MADDDRRDEPERWQPPDRWQPPKREEVETEKPETASSEPALPSVPPPGSTTERVNPPVEPPSFPTPPAPTPRIEPTNPDAPKRDWLTPGDPSSTTEPAPPPEAPAATSTVEEDLPAIPAPGDEPFEEPAPRDAPKGTEAPSWLTPKTDDTAAMPEVRPWQRVGDTPAPAEAPITEYGVGPSAPADAPPSRSTTPPPPPPLTPSIPPVGSTGTRPWETRQVPPAALKEPEPEVEEAQITRRERRLAEERRPVGEVRKLRRGRLAIRKLDPISVFRFSMVFYFCTMLVMLLAAGFIYAALRAVGVVTNLEQLVGELIRSDFKIAGFRLFLLSFVAGSIWTVIASIVTTFAAFLYNLIADVVGGVEMIVVEREQ